MALLGGVLVLSMVKLVVTFSGFKFHLLRYLLVNRTDSLVILGLGGVSTIVKSFQNKDLKIIEINERGLDEESHVTIGDNLITQLLSC